MKKIIITSFIFTLFLCFGAMRPAFAVKHTITQQGFSFNPSAINNVSLGDTIRWVWTSGFHTTTSTVIPGGASAWDAILASSSPVFEYIPAVTGTYNYKCTPHEFMGMIGSFTVAGPTGNSLSGHLYYNNNTPTGMGGCIIKLTNSIGDAISSTTTDISGFYSFSGIAGGAYSIQAVPSASPGGFNANDALQALKHFVNISHLVGLRFIAGDVDNTQFINAVDALSISRRFVGLQSTFTAGDWYVEPALISLTGNTSFTRNINAICYGDVDGSYTGFGSSPKPAPVAGLNRHTIMNLRTGQNISIPININCSTGINAISLGFRYADDQLRINNVRVNNNEGMLVFNAENGLLKIAWFSLNSMNPEVGSPAVIIDATSLETLTEGNIISFEPTNEIILGDANGDEINDATISIPQLKNTLTGSVTHIITQQGLTFNPSNLTGVHVSDTVRWIWTGGTHTTTSSTIPVGAQAWDAVLMSSSPKFDYVVAETGTYNYICTPHVSLGMTGKFTVDNTATGVQTIDASKSNFQLNITPNPVVDNGTLSFISAAPGKGELIIKNILGEEMINIPVEIVNGTNNIALNMSDLKSGLYLASLKSGNSLMTTAKFVH